jgi:hypothetical protein
LGLGRWFASPFIGYAALYLFQLLAYTEKGRFKVMIAFREDGVGSERVGLSQAFFDTFHRNTGVFCIRLIN